MLRICFIEYYGILFYSIGDAASGDRSSLLGRIGILKRPNKVVIELGRLAKPLLLHNWGPTGWGPTIWGPTVWRPTVWGPTVSGRRFRARQSGHPFGSLQHGGLQSGGLQYRCLESGGQQCRATGFEPDKALTRLGAYSMGGLHYGGLQRGGPTVSGHRFRARTSTHPSERRVIGDPLPRTFFREIS